ncbi:SIS domain-containing protein [Sandaracinobacter sp. RS1-74]|uniref:SIS domain-containing protein n=1 Tax=Sandaracinobacteroides sayramensis TaxID=2913411 RepID=UPI001EDAF73C|nr:SIS domain-containing protein [Sandaracinobacteroides sayramensis]MCG2842101.1 SIS domain-containing protein [Sandaracinobacteroides sayramensis]
MNGPRTRMFLEAAEAGAVVARQLAANAGAVSRAAGLMKARETDLLLTLARGSSDNAATFLRYWVEQRAGLPTGSFSPSTASVYGVTPALARAAAVAVSQSGRSPDLLAAAERLRAGGALLLALVNDETSPLAASADLLLPLHAGPERSVAATKSFIASLSAMLHLLSAWHGDAELARALVALPSALDRAFELDWSAALPRLVGAEHLYVVARGPALGVAQEMALKVKETCGFHAEAFSAAEVKHGPMALVRDGFPVLLLGQQDEALESVRELAGLFEANRATLMTAGLPKGAPGIALPVLEDAPAAIQPILLAQSFYRLANSLSLARGRDPDTPPGLRKVTETL